MNRRIHRTMWTVQILLSAILLSLCASCASMLDNAAKTEGKLVSSKLSRVITNMPPHKYEVSGKTVVINASLQLDLKIKACQKQQCIYKNTYTVEKEKNLKTSIAGGFLSSSEITRELFEPGVREVTTTPKAIRLKVDADINGAKSQKLYTVSGDEAITLDLSEQLKQIVPPDQAVSSFEILVTVDDPPAPGGVLWNLAPDNWSDSIIVLAELGNNDAAARLAENKVTDIINTDPPGKSLVVEDTVDDENEAGSDETPVVITDLVSEGSPPKAFVHRWMLKRISEDKLKVSYDQVFDLEYMKRTWNAAMEGGAQGVRAYDEISSWSRWKDGIEREYRNEGRIGFTTISREQVPALLAIYAKYAEWKDVSAREKLVKGVGQALPSVGEIDCMFVTPDRLLVGDWKMNAEDVSRISQLLNRADELEKIVAERALEKSQAAEQKERQQRDEEALKNQRETERLQAEERARSLLK